MIDTFGNAHWWIGIVEDRNDPLKLGRVRVRIFGYHSEKLQVDEKGGEGAPTEALPWAMPAMPITSASMNGIGETPAPVEGSIVVGISLDGRAMQNLLYMFTLPSIPQEAAKKIGFNDIEAGFKASERPHRPDDPQEPYPKKNYLKEPDTNRLARNEKTDKTIIKKKNDSLDKNIPIALGGKWNEPKTPYNAKFPFNKVIETESGHVIEFDDTPKAERIHIYHRAGTFIEVHPDGSIVVKTKGNRFEIVEKDTNRHIKGNRNETVDKDATLYVKGNTKIQVDGNVDAHVKGNVNQTIDGNVNQKVGKNVNQNVSGNVSQNVSGNINQSASGNITISAGGNVKISGSRIDLN